MTKKYLYYTELPTKQKGYKIYYISENEFENMRKGYFLSSWNFIYRKLNYKEKMFWKAHLKRVCKNLIIFYKNNNVSLKLWELFLVLLGAFAFWIAQHLFHFR